MSEVLERFADSQFVDLLVSMSPAVGVGVCLGVVAAIIGWLYGFVIRIAKVDL